MSELTIASDFPFRRIRIVNQCVNNDAIKASIEILPHRRFKPIRQLVLTHFANMLERHRYGIVNHCSYPIHTGTGIRSMGLTTRSKSSNERHMAIAIYSTLH